MVFARIENAHVVQGNNKGEVNCRCLLKVGICEMRGHEGSIRVMWGMDPLPSIDTGLTFPESGQGGQSESGRLVAPGIQTFLFAVAGYDVNKACSVEQEGGSNTHWA
jgi:hypothetical protein